MPRVKRPDGAEIQWQERGDPGGQLLVIAMHFMASAAVFEGLIADLARDHRVVTYDLRGTGESTRAGPYAMDVDAADLGAVVEAARETAPQRGEEPAIAVAFGDGANRAVRLAVERPDLVEVVVGPAGNPLGRQASEGGIGLASSDGVLELLQDQMALDYRGALRTLVSSANPDWDEDTIRERVESNHQHVPQEAAVARVANWIADDALELSLALGDRLWIVSHPHNPWFPPELAERTRQLAPEAHVVQVAEGPVTRPDLHAAVVREAADRARS